MIFISKRIAILFVFCFVIYSFFDVLKDCDANGVLPDGVVEVEITDWTKTREPSEIGQGEKKINSHANLGELNNCISSQDVDIIEGLYDSSMELMDMNIVNSNRISNGEEEITGNKILRTIVKDENETLGYDIRTLRQYLKSNEPVNWQDGRVSWNLHTTSEENSIEWRMISGKINISSDNLNLLNTNKYQAVLGIPADNECGFELIVPFDDIISVFVNNSSTLTNYEDENLVNEYKLNNISTSYKDCSDCRKTSYHSGLCSHTTAHIDMDVLATNTRFLRNNLSKKLKLGENEIDFLIGSFASSNCTIQDSYGFSKLNLYLIEEPSVKVSLDFYKYEGQEIIYFDNNYKPDMNEEVYFRVKINNESSNMDLENIDLNMKIGDKFFLKFNEGGIFYKEARVGDCTSSILPRLGEIVLTSEDFKYTVTKEDCLRGIVYTTVKVRGDYLLENLPYFNSFEKTSNSVDKRLKNYVEKEIASLSVNCEIEGGDEEVVLQLKSSSNFCNIFLRDGHTSNIRNLGLKTYTISAVVPQGYQVVECPSSVTFSNLNLSRSITVKLRKNKLNCFYKNDRVAVDFG